MKTFVGALLVVACAVALPGVEPQQLFNGKDLSGWARIPRHEGARVMN
jgi:hypothetical protein